MVRTNNNVIRYFGAHVSAAGGLENALTAGKELGINTIQIHPSPPQRWNGKPFPKGVEDKFLAGREDSPVKRIFFHGIYLINLANPDPQKFHLSKISLVHYLDLLQRIGGDGVIFHVGSFKDQEDEDSGYKQIIMGIDWIFAQADNPARLILEVAAGSGKIVGDRMEELKRIYDGVEKKERLGFGLDSQHMWASGYDLKSKMEEVVEEVGHVFGFDKVWAIHLNDSKTALASKTDRHENLGAGLIGEQALCGLLAHPKLAHIPFILETPALKNMESAKPEVEKLRGWVSSIIA
ncbi:MAG: hypothetical protein DCC75_01840 [Proteobacteria bacterium]|nr:MAG: hypothetical protein DCC75_01840 [Pseudomonadota bacterium]